MFFSRHGDALNAGRRATPIVSTWQLAITVVAFKPMGTSKNCRRLSGAPNLRANDSALFSFRFCAVHPKGALDCQLQQFFEVPPIEVRFLL
jgi:hypothetical protein